MAERYKPRHGTAGDNVTADLATIPCLTRQELLERWQAAYEHPAPKGISRRLLEYAASHQVQAEAFGNLSSPARRKLARHMPGARVPSASAKPARSKAVSPGTRFVRAWHGRTHTVDVQDDGVLYEGQHYRSLSEVARVITGARWSGPRFFGL